MFSPIRLLRVRTTLRDATLRRSWRGGVWRLLCSRTPACQQDTLCGCQGVAASYAARAANTIGRFASWGPGMKIAVGGMQHETNTFAPTRADLEAFVKGGGWPTIQYGDSLFDAVDGANLPVAGAIDSLRAGGHAGRAAGLGRGVAVGARDARGLRDHRRQPGRSGCRTRCRSTASTSTCTARWSASTSTTAKARSWRRVRQLVGDRVPVVASLDLHANVTRADGAVRPMR